MFSGLISPGLSKRHTLFSSVADRRFNLVEGEARQRVHLDVQHQFLKLPGVPSSAFFKNNSMGGGGGGNLNSSRGGGSGATPTLGDTGAARGR